jgi:hemerythrin-like metal-binding protein
VRESDTVARLGGDEFTIILQGIACPQDALHVAAQVVKQLRAPIDAGGGRECLIGASVGIALYPHHGRDLDTLLAHADQAMYQSKHSGKNTFTLYEPAPSDHEAVPRQPLIVWTRDREVGVSIIDEQHKELMDRLNSLVDALTDAESRETIKRLLEGLLNFTRHHFTTEENLMRRYSYEHIGPHHHQHQSLLDDLLRIDQDFEADGLTRTLLAVKNWFFKHIKHSDVPLACHLLAHGYKGADEPS